MTHSRLLLLVFSTTSFVLAGSANVTAQNAAQQSPIDVERYRFELELTDTDDVVRGAAEIHFDLRVEASSGSEFWFDLIAEEVSEGVSSGMTVDGVWLLKSTGSDLELQETGRWMHEDDRVTLAVSQRDWTSLEGVRIEYHGVPKDGLVIGNDRHGQRTFFGDNWPNRARHWLPVIDHPSDKAFATFAVTAPSAYQVISVGERVSERDLGDGRRTTTWSSRHPLPTKVMVMGAAKFYVERQGFVRGVPIESWIFAGDFPEANDAFDETAGVVEFFVDRLGAFPYSKLANVQSKTRFGGMENASAIFYSEAAVARGASEGLVAHEIAHQWFGDSVTEAAWPHVWLSEGFATYMTALYLEWRYGSERLEETMRMARRRVVDLAAREPAAVIPQQVDDLMNLLSANSYQKGAWVLHMLRREVGNDVFWQALRNYYAQYRDGNATTDQFRVVVEQTQRDMVDESEVAGLAWFFEQWLERPGQPRLAVTFQLQETEPSNFEPDAPRMVRLSGRQQPFEPDAEPFRFSLDIDLVAADGSKQRASLEFSDWSMEAAIETPFEPVSIVLDPDAWLLHEQLPASSSR